MMQTFEKHVHSSLMIKIVMFEFYSPNDSPEYRRTLFEKLLDIWPKRLDPWNQLIDLEISLFVTEKVKGTKGRNDMAVVYHMFE